MNLCDWPTCNASGRFDSRERHRDRHRRPSTSPRLNIECAPDRLDPFADAHEAETFAPRFVDSEPDPVIGNREREAVRRRRGDGR